MIRDAGVSIRALAWRARPTQAEKLLCSRLLINTLVHNANIQAAMFCIHTHILTSQPCVRCADAAQLESDAPCANSNTSLCKCS